MVALNLNSTTLSDIKSALRKALPAFGSAHISEALASALGFRCNAALRERIAQVEREGFPQLVLLDGNAFWGRLANLRGSAATNVDEEIFDTLKADLSGYVLVTTRPSSVRQIGYSSARAQGWRNLMIAAVNAGLAQKHFSLKPGDNRWPTTQNQGHVYEFIFDNEIEAIGYVNDAGWDELTIHVALWPARDGRKFVRTVNAGFYAGEAYATGWLERRSGAWLQSSPDSLRCRKKLLSRIAGATVAPSGFGDRGKVIL
ncbi:MAG: hypothetical protein KGL35_09230 [Bradyrhizobium sp.]|nr:hypothetical protein [Pseudomonadota bacterium]MDE2468908.1 hypothetical protein [Bradyrhizobium sp.]